MLRSPIGDGAIPTDDEFLLHSTATFDRARAGRDVPSDFPKRAVDIASALVAMPIVLFFCVVLVIANPIWNPGRLFFLQKRMGHGCRSFITIKFRTMRDAPRITRGPEDPVECERVTRLGRLLRVTRIDELPQFINVLGGEMSLIGPRPDYWDHAVHYLQSVPGYRERHKVRPGITGLAQVQTGYAEGISATVRKTHIDLRYIRTRSARMELYVVWRTLVVLSTGFGAR
ncbi:MAG TPA: sugar transferase [Thermohalobaculum sp.]|nr:sugar transferase [Thermohalobaculum sp.]